MDQPTMYYRSQEKYLKYKHRAVIIGWLGEFLSSLMLVVAALALQFSDDVVQVVMQVMSHGMDMYNRVLHGVILISSAFYAMSLVNILICALMLIGISRRCTVLVFPWIFYHGLLFGISIYLAIYVIVSGVLVPFELFLVISAVFSIGLVLFFRIVSDILMLFKWMHAMDEIEAESYRQGCLDGERNEGSEDDICSQCQF